MTACQLSASSWSGCPRSAGTARTEATRNSGRAASTAEPVPPGPDSAPKGRAPVVGAPQRPTGLVLARSSARSSRPARSVSWARGPASRLGVAEGLTRLDANGDAPVLGAGAVRGLAPRDHQHRFTHSPRQPGRHRSRRPRPAPAADQPESSVQSSSMAKPTPTARHLTWASGKRTEPTGRAKATGAC